MNSPLFRRVLVVDDELNIVSAVRRELSTPPLGRYRYEVEGFSEPAQALERARSQSFDAVISDYRMPGMSGLEFLKALAAIQPECARLVLSGQTDMDGLVKMVNETHIYRFIPKPWHDYFLKSSVAQAIEFNLALQENRRLAGVVRERGIAVPALLENDAENILIVDDEAAILSSLSRVLSGHTQADDLFAVIRAELSRQGGAVLDEARSKVVVTTSAREALKMAETQAFAFQAGAVTSMLPALLLSGFIFPIRSMPSVLQAITYAVPARYYLVILRGVILKGAGLEPYRRQMWFLALYAVLVLGIAALRLRRKEK